MNEIKKGDPLTYFKELFGGEPKEVKPADVVAKIRETFDTAINYKVHAEMAEWHPWDAQTYVRLAGAVDKDDLYRKYGAATEALMSTVRASQPFVTEDLSFLPGEVGNLGRMARWEDLLKDSDLSPEQRQVLEGKISLKP